MRIYELGARVYGGDGELWGRLAQLVYHAETHVVSHAVVYSADDGRARLVPLSMTHPAPDGILLSCSSGAVETMTSPIAVRLLARPAGRRSRRPARWPAAPLTPRTEQESAEYLVEAGEHLPAGSVPVWLKQPVRATDGEAGRVRGLVLDDDSDETLDIVLEPKRFWNRGRMAVPIDAVAEITHNSVRLRWARSAVKGLPRL